MHSSRSKAPLTRCTIVTADPRFIVPGDKWAIHTQAPNRQALSAFQATTYRHDGGKKSKRIDHKAPARESASDSEIRQFLEAHPSQHPLSALGDLPAIKELHAAHKASEFKIPLERLHAIREKLKAHPFWNVGGAVLRALSDHPMVILSSPTGSGKTTGLPLLALFKEHQTTAPGGAKEHCEMPFSSVDVIVPRRGLASETAGFTSEHFLLQKPGELIGISTGRTKQFGEQTRILYQTTGVAWLAIHPQKKQKEFQNKLRQLSSDHLFILDEFHERQVHVDILLGLLVKEMQYRIEHNIPCFRVVISSATINTRSLKTHLESLLNRGQKSAKKSVATVTATYPNGKINNPRVQIKSFQGGVGDYTAAARVAVEMSGKGYTPLILAPNITIQRGITQAIQESLDDPFALADRSIQPFEVNSKSSDRDREILTGKFPKGVKPIVVSTVSRSGGTYPGFTCLIDPCIVTDSRTGWLNGKIPYKAQVLRTATKCEIQQGAGRMGRIASRDGRKDLVLLPSGLKRAPQRDFPIPDILDTPEMGASRLSLSIAVQPGHQSPRLFDFKGLPIMVALNDNKQLAWERFLMIIGAVSNQGHLTKLGLRMREIPGSLEVRKLVALAQHQGDSTLLRLACECAALVENEGLLANPKGQPKWARKEFTYRSDLLRELDYLRLLQRAQREHGDGYLATFCAHNDLSFKAFERVQQSLVKLLEVAELPIETDLPEKIDQIDPTLLNKLVGIIQESYLHYFLRRPSINASWSSSIESSLLWKAGRDSMVNINGDVYCVAQPVGRLEEDHSGRCTPEDDNNFGKLYWCTAITAAELAAHLRRYPLMAPLFEGFLSSRLAAGPRNFPVKTAPGQRDGPRGSQRRP